MKCETCWSGQNLLKIPNYTMENVNKLNTLADKSNHGQSTDALKARLVTATLPLLMFLDSYGIISTHSVRDILIRFIFNFFFLSIV